MKQVIFFFSCLFLLSIIITSCEDTSGFNSPIDVETLVPTNDLQSPAFSSFANAPTESGIVMRGEWPVAVTWVADGMRVIIGADIIEFCDGLEDFDIISFQDVHVTDERIVSIARGSDFRTAVYDFIEFDCYYFMSTPPLAQGYSDLKNTDNDLNGIGEGENHANSWGWIARGTLTDADGEVVKFSGHVRNVWNGNRFNSQRKIKLIY